MDLIVDLNQRNGQTFVVVTHDIRVAERCFHIINMLDGEIVSETETDRGRAQTRNGAAVI
jgi:putative ABC transport system ATP-binding protein